jgi:hypothetical protein
MKKDEFEERLRRACEAQEENRRAAREERLSVVVQCVMVLCALGLVFVVFWSASRMGVPELPGSTAGGSWSAHYP